MNKSTNIYERIIEYVFIMFLFAVYSVFGLFLTTGAAFSAGFMSARERQKNETDAPTHVIFHKQFMDSFKPATFTWVTMVLLGLGIVQLYAWAFDPSSVPRLIVFYVALLYWTLFHLYIYPLHSVFKHRGPLHVIKNTMLIIHLHPKVLFKMLVIASIMFLLIETIHPVLTPVALTLYFYLQARWLSPTFDFYIERVKAREN